MHGFIRGIRAIRGSLFRVIAVLVLAAGVARAHIGSPNVFFEGHAGPHAVRVIIRPPATLPGVAQVDVRVAEEGAARVTVQSIFAQAGAANAPAPTEATPVTGDPRLFNAPVWLFRNGTFRIEVAVEGEGGRGSVSVPLASAATQTPQMSASLRGTLIALGVLLFLGAIAIAGAAARDAALAPGDEPTWRDVGRGRRVAVLVALLLGGALYGGTVRWQRMDRDFRNNALAQPVPVAARIRTEDTLHRLVLTPPPGAVTAHDWSALAADHGKLMHLFLIRAEGGNAFAHLHPARRDPRTFEAVLPPLPPGIYRLYAELTYESGMTETLVGEVDLPAPLGLAAQAGWTMINEVWCQSPLATSAKSAQPDALEADDSWHAAPPSSATTRTSALMGGARMVFQTPGPLIADREMALRFAVFDPAGESVPIQPYMGMLGHAVIRRTDGTVFTHLHPVGTISMAAQALISAPTPVPAAAPEPKAATHEVTFPYAFPRSGDYRMWAQVRLAGRVVTGVFDVRVEAAR